MSNGLQEEVVEAQRIYGIHKQSVKTSKTANLQLTGISRTPPKTLVTSICRASKYSRFFSLLSSTKVLAPVNISFAYFKILCVNSVGISLFFN